MMGIDRLGVVIVNYIEGECPYCIGKGILFI
jgi:hypothetical protein